MYTNGYWGKYESNKDFFTNGIQDKDKYPNWYVTAIYFSAYHLICSYYHKIGQTIPMTNRELIIIRDLNEVKNQVRLMETKSKVALFGGLDVHISDTKNVKDAYDIVEQFMIPKIA